MAFILTVSITRSRGFQPFILSDCSVQALNQLNQPFVDKKTLRYIFHAKKIGRAFALFVVAMNIHSWVAGTQLQAFPLSFRHLFWPFCPFFASLYQLLVSLGPYYNRRTLSVSLCSYFSEHFLFLSREKRDNANIMSFCFLFLSVWDRRRWI